MPTIEVSADVYQRLAALAKPFEDREPNDVIRRLLDSAGNDSIKARLENGRGRDMVSHVGRLPHKAQLRARYKGREFFGTIENGRVLWEGRSFDSLSQAAVAVIRSTGSNRPTENGWRFWQVQEAPGKPWRPAEKYRSR